MLVVMLFIAVIMCFSGILEASLFHPSASSNNNIIINAQEGSEEGKLSKVSLKKNIKVIKGGYQGSGVRHITSLSDFETLLNNRKNKGKLIVVDFTATWCGPCKMIAPFFEEMAGEFDDSCVFVKVDVDEGADIAREYKVMSMPTFIFFKDGDVVDRFSGKTNLNYMLYYYIHIQYIHLYACSVVYNGYTHLIRI